MDFNTIWEHGNHIAPLIFKEEGEILFQAVSELGDKAVVVEIGSYVGRSADVMAQVCEARGYKLICIDPFVVGFDGVGMEGSKEQFYKNIMEVYNCVELIEAKSEDVYKEVPDIDFLFIDGDHDREGIEKDCKYYLPKLKSNHLVSFHDYHNTSFPQIPDVVNYYCSGWEVVNNAFSIHTRRKP